MKYYTNSYKISIYNNRKKIWAISLILVLLSVLGFIFSYTNSEIRSPIRQGLDFTGGTQIKVDRVCDDKKCYKLDINKIENQIRQIDFTDSINKTSVNLSNFRVQALDDSSSIILRFPFLSSDQSNKVIENIPPIIGKIDKQSIAVDTIGPTLGKQLLRSSVVSLLVAFLAITIYISVRFDKLFASLALLALAHDIIIVCGIVSWMGIFFNAEVNSLFAVAILTIAGYSVNDTVVIFDRIREINKNNTDTYIEKIDKAVNSSLTRTLYTSGSTLIPLFALILFGGNTLTQFAVTLAIGIIIGSWSSIALAPSILSVSKNKSLNN